VLCSGVSRKVEHRTLDLLKSNEETENLPTAEELTEATFDGVEELALVRRILISGSKLMLLSDRV
jgi:hypothetical protein